MGIELQPPSCVDHYADLGVSQDASTQEIRRAFYKLAKETHPDKNNNETTHTPKFRKAQEAYECLCDATKRQVYDEKYPAIRAEWARYHHNLTHPHLHPHTTEITKNNTELNNFNFGFSTPTHSAYLSEEERRAKIEEFRRRMEEGRRRMDESRRAMEDNRRKMAGCNRTMDDFFARWQSLQFPFRSQMSSSPLWTSMSRGSGPFMTSMRL